MITEETRQEAALMGRIKVKCPTYEGKDVEVSLRLVPISKIPEYLDLVLEEEKALRFTIASPQDLDLDTLTDESYEMLVNTSHELNFTRALDFQTKRMARAEQSGQGLKGILQTTVALLQKYAPPSPSGAASPESKS